MEKSHFTVWIFAVAVSYVIFKDLEYWQFIAPLIAVSGIALLVAKYRIKHIEYLLFFTISFASLLGLTETLDGSHAESSNVLLYGLSFYTASMAFLIAKNKFNYKKVLAVSNPLLLSTGPIALFIEGISHKNLKQRIKYYFPFIIIGTFMFQIIGRPLTEFFFLIEKTDVMSVITFAAIFEIFVYMNFCGLSLMIYGLFGLFGYRIPLNFNQPFSSRNIVEFWRGWHTSLSQVLKILFYNPIREKFSLFYALLGVYIASAMWHGVTFNFILWGTFHAFFFWLSIKLLKQRNNVLPLILMPFIILVGRLIFADSDIDRLMEKLIFNFGGLDGIKPILFVSKTSLLALFFGSIIITIEFVFRNTKVMKKRNYKFLRTPFGLLVLCVLGVIFITDVGVDYAVYGQR